MRLAVLLVGLGMATAASAQGRMLHDSACMQCHAALGKGDPNYLYQRDDRTVSTLAGLRQRVRHCAIAADVDWSDAEREAVIAYLRREFYPF